MIKKKLFYFSKLLNSQSRSTAMYSHENNINHQWYITHTPPAKKQADPEALGAPSTNNQRIFAPLGQITAAAAGLSTYGREQVVNAETWSRRFDVDALEATTGTTTSWRRFRPGAQKRTGTQ